MNPSLRPHQTKLNPTFYFIFFFFKASTQLYMKATCESVATWTWNDERYGREPLGVAGPGGRGRAGSLGHFLCRCFFGRRSVSGVTDKGGTDSSAPAPAPSPAPAPLPLLLPLRSHNEAKSGTMAVQSGPDPLRRTAARCGRHGRNLTFVDRRLFLFNPFLTVGAIQMKKKKKIAPFEPLEINKTVQLNSSIEILL